MVISGDKLTVFLLINNQAETNITFPELVTVPNGSSDPDYGASILIRNCPINYIAVPLLRDIPGISLDDCDALESFSAPKLETRSVLLQNCDELREIDVPVFVGEYFTLNNCPKVASLHVPVMPDGLLNINSNAGLKSISFPALVRGELNISQHAILKVLSFPSLAVVTDGNYGFNVYENPALEIVSLPALDTCETVLNINANPALQRVSASAASAIRNSNIVNNAVLTDIDLGDALFTNGFDHLFSGNALTADSVNGILARCVDSGLTSNTIDLSGGTNAAPTGQGLVNKATLIAAGCTVNTN